MLVYKAHGIPLVIATDDAGVSRSTLSNEYLMFCDRYKPNYAELKTLVYNSIRFSFLSNNEKREQLQKLDARFLAFEAMIAHVASTLGDSGLSSSSPPSKEITSQIALFCCSVWLLIKPTVW